MPYLEISYDDLEFLEECGAGSFGAVYRAKWKSQGKEVAVKKLMKLDSEVCVLSTLSHAHIIRFFGAVTSPPNYCLVTEYAALGSLYDYLQKNSLQHQQILTWARHIALGLRYLHTEAPETVIHRDLKSKNVVITSDLIAKICDFGTARFNKGSTRNTNMAGTFPWMAPEVIKSLKVSMKSDTFSYGVLLWEMLTGEIPYRGMEGLHVAWIVVDRDERLPIPKTCPHSFANLMKKCWLKDPKERPSFKEVHEILKSMGRDDGLEKMTNTFLAHREDFRKEIENTLDKLRKLEIGLKKKEKELTDREKRVHQRERELEQPGAEMNTDDVKYWNEDDVGAWICHISAGDKDTFASYAQLFVQNHIKGGRLLVLDETDLEDLGILSLGHRKKLLEQIQHLKTENSMQYDFPPLSKDGNSPEKAYQTMTFTLLFGNDCQFSDQPLETKWKMYVEVDGEDAAITQIKDVVFTVRTDPPDIYTITEPPFTMDNWDVVGVDTPVVDCVVTYKSNVKKPRSTKHTHTVALERGGGQIHQREVTLTLKQSAPVILGSSTSPLAATANQKGLHKSSSGTALLISDWNKGKPAAFQGSTTSWASRVAVNTPKTTESGTLDDPVGASRDSAADERRRSSGDCQIPRTLSTSSVASSTPCNGSCTDEDREAEEGSRHTSSPSAWTTVKTKKNKKDKPAGTNNPQTSSGRGRPSWRGQGTRERGRGQQSHNTQSYNGRGQAQRGRGRAPDYRRTVSDQSQITRNRSCDNNMDTRTTSSEGAIRQTASNTSLSTSSKQGRGTGRDRVFSWSKIGDMLPSESSARPADKPAKQEEEGLWMGQRSGQQSRRKSRK